MDTIEENRNPFIGSLLPLTLLGAAAIMFFAGQLGSIKQGTAAMEWQDKNADKSIKNLTEANEQLTKNVEARKALVAQSEQLQKQFTDLMKELDILARGGDKDADMIIKGYGIKVNEPAGGSSTPAAADKPADKPAEKPDKPANP
jgi:hypothetical protein